MNSRPSPANRQTLTGWRARAWAWVLFAALIKGLIPHAALASIAMQGNPALMWCAPGMGAAEAAGGAAAVAHDCVCASASDGAPALSDQPLFAAALGPVGALPSRQIAAAPQRLLPPPARGPPAL